MADSSPPNEQRTTQFSQVLEAEWTEVSRRRQAIDKARGVHKTPEKTDGAPAPNLVGVAMSGGGIRAASIGLGALQALHNRDDRLKEVDYLSTVSGGGYIGGYLSSAVVSTSTSVDEALAITQAASASSVGERREATDFGQPATVQRLIFGGKYLNRPWEAANKYLIGLFSINLVVGSALIMFCALVALLWRALDYDSVRDFMALFGLNSGIIAAFLPFGIFACCWLIAWTVSYFKHEGEAPGTWAQRLLYLTAGSFLVGFTILLVTPDIKVGFLRVFTGNGKIGNESSLSRWALGLVAAALLPLLAPHIIWRRGIHPESFRDRVVFRIATTALLVGVPLVIVGILAMPNISDTARDPEDNLRAGDIMSWPAFLALMGPENQTPLDKKQLDRLHDLEGEWKSGKLQPWMKNRKVDIRTLRNLTRVELSQQANSLREQMDELNPLYEEFKSLPAWHRVIGLLRGPESDDVLYEYWRQSRKVKRAQEEFCDRFSTYVLGSRELPRSLLTKTLLSPEEAVPRLDNPLQGKDEKESKRAAIAGERQPAAATAEQRLIAAVALALVGVPPSGGDEPAANSTAVASDKSEDANSPKTVFAKIAQILLAQQKEKVSVDGFDSEDISDAELSFLDWDAANIKEFNLRLMRAMNPECYFVLGKPYRHLVTAADQVRRGWIFAIAAVVCLCAGAIVNLNSTSLHRFYRNRIRHAYLAPYREGRADFALSSLGGTEDPTKTPAPYHLINASVDLTRPRFLDEVDAECGDPKADRSDVQTFLFSKRYCGCDATGWARTEHYETFRDDNINVADAIALSGSAVSPLRAPSAGIAAAMSVLNLNLGQWMPNPRFEKPRSRPTFFALLRDWLLRPAEKSAYCYVSDGGFCENLGIVPLLRRRCRVIVAIDASCDGSQSFSDLNRVIRIARIRFGIKILEPGQPADSEQALGTDCLEPGKKGKCERHFLLGRVVYPDDPDPAWLVYLKPSFTGDEGADLMKYRVEAPEFPNDNTLDQFYNPARVEAYRQLGFHMMSDFLQRVAECHEPTFWEGVSALHEQLKEAKAATPEARPTKAVRREVCHRSGVYSAECGHLPPLNFSKNEEFLDCAVCRAKGGSGIVRWSEDATS